MASVQVTVSKKVQNNLSSENKDADSIWLAGLVSVGQVNVLGALQGNLDGARLRPTYVTRPSGQLRANKYSEFRIFKILGMLHFSLT